MDIILQLIPAAVLAVADAILIYKRGLDKFAAIACVVIGAVALVEGPITAVTMLFMWYLVLTVAKFFIDRYNNRG